MLKFFVEICKLARCSRVCRNLCMLVCLSFLLPTSILGCEAVHVDATQLRGVLKRMLRVRVGRDTKRSIRAMLRKDQSDINPQEILDLIPAIRGYLTRRLNRPGRSASKVQIRALAYLSAMKNALESVNFDKSQNRSLTKLFSDEIDQLFEQLPQHYSVLAIRAPSLDAFGKGSREITEGQVSPCLDLELGKFSSLVDQLLTVESKVDSSDQAALTMCSKIEVIDGDEQAFESSISVLSSKLEEIDNALDAIELNSGSIESHIDIFATLNTKANSISDGMSVIDSMAVDVDDEFLSVLSKVNVLDGNIDTISGTISKIDIIVSKSSQNATKSCDILTRLNAMVVMGGDLDQIESCIDVIKSDIDVVISVLSP